MAVNRIVVGAGYGFKDWLLQRVTAVVMAVYFLLIVTILVVVRPADFESWRGIFASRPVAVATFVFALSLFYHAWVGIRDLYMDYVKNPSLRLVLHVLTVTVLTGYAVWTALILWRL
ncbi:MAG: succinate dehydrogenase, hydrophobic membrane anchor protein [Zoogloeaceae bacterium]|jgi:succinate dehydrogenase / fumarate reductase membrane anchor subunit|nr:succinate dehydrogenase, hydrophobic membrane anchor protein [Zoogloeaceae bacterium]